MTYIGIDREKDGWLVRGLRWWVLLCYAILVDISTAWNMYIYLLLVFAGLDSFLNWYGGRFASKSYPWSGKVLSSVDYPLEDRDEQDDSKGDNTVVCSALELLVAQTGLDLLMLPPETGSSGGNTNSTDVKMI